MERFSRAMRAGPVLVRIPGFFNACHTRATCVPHAPLHGADSVSMLFQELDVVESACALAIFCNMLRV